MTDPDRAARLWLTVAVATLWLLSVGGEAEATVPASTLLDVTAALAQGRRQRRATGLRLVSVFRRGLILIWVALLNRQLLPMGRFLPEPWPAVPRHHHVPRPLQEELQRAAQKPTPERGRGHGTSTWRRAWARRVRWLGTGHRW